MSLEARKWLLDNREQILRELVYVRDNKQSLSLPFKKIEVIRDVDTR